MKRRRRRRRTRRRRRRRRSGGGGGGGEVGGVEGKGLKYGASLSGGALHIWGCWVGVRFRPVKKNFFPVS